MTSARISEIQVRGLLQWTHPSSCDDLIVKLLALQRRDFTAACVPWATGSRALQGRDVPHPTAGL